LGTVNIPPIKIVIWEMAYDFFSEKMVDEKKNIRKLGENKKQIGLPGFLVTPNSWILSRW